MVKHPVILRGFGAAPLEDEAPPLIVKRTEEDFVQALLDGLGEKESRNELGAPTAADRPNGRLKLSQPMHRAFHLVVMEAVCERPGRPRLNPRDIESAGFVIRRVSGQGSITADQGWQRAGKQVLGWQNFPSESWRMDPDPERRPVRALRAPNGVQVALTRLRVATEPARESAVPMFVAPPEICEQAGRTVLYGVVPTASAEERTSREPVTVDADVVTTLMPEFLREGAGNYRPFGTTRYLTMVQVKTAEATGLTGTFGLFLLGLRTLHQVWRVFSAPEAANLLAELQGVQVEFQHGRTDNLSHYLSEAARIFLAERPENGVIEVPDVWPFPEAALAQRYFNAAKLTLEAHYAGSPPQIKRFDEPGAEYRIHSFIRVRGDDDCPPRLCWSAPSERFTIAPWWENGGPVHTISMPDVDALRALKPNVAFAMPPKLANLLNRMNPEDMLKGKGEASASPELGWICSFSIPIITLCAFIVLNIFLGLFNLIFQWMLFIKICLPFPKKALPPQP